MRRGGLFAAIAVLISVLCACGGHAAATPALPVSNAPVGMPRMLVDIPDAKTGEKIYISNSAANNIVTYTTAGKATKPTITKNINDPGIIAVNSKGNIFVPNYYDDTVTTYESNGKPTKPTIKVGLNEPTGVAVDSKGKIYVSNAFTSNVTTYKPNGQQTTPTIANIDGPRGIAVDAKGKIYVANFGSGMVTTYTADGKPAKPTITGLSGPGGIAVDKNGKIYVTNYYGNTLVTFTASGKPTNPTITRIGDALRRGGRRGGKDLCDKSQSPKTPDVHGQRRAEHTDDHDVERTVGCGHPLSRRRDRLESGRMCATPNGSALVIGGKGKPDPLRS